MLKNFTPTLCAVALSFVATNAHATIRINTGTDDAGVAIILSIVGTIALTVIATLIMRKMKDSKAIDRDPKDAGHFNPRGKKFSSNDRFSARRR